MADNRSGTYHGAVADGYAGKDDYTRANEHVIAYTNIGRKPGVLNWHTWLDRVRVRQKDTLRPNRHAVTQHDASLQCIDIDSPSKMGICTHAELPRSRENRAATVDNRCGTDSDGRWVRQMDVGIYLRPVAEVRKVLCRVDGLVEPPQDEDAQSMRPRRLATHLRFQARPGQQAWHRSESFWDGKAGSLRWRRPLLQRCKILQRSQRVTVPPHRDGPAQ